MSSMSPLLQGPVALWTVRVPPGEVVFLKGIFEASEGIGSVFADPRPRGAPRTGGTVTVFAPLGLEAEAARVLLDLKRELGDSMQVERLGPVASAPERGTRP